MNTFGIDYARVDNNRHPIGFNQARDAGCRFAILRAAWGTAQDSIYRRDAAALRAADISVGSYLFLRMPTKRQDVADPETQARTLIANVGTLEPLDLPPTLDVEFPGGGRTDTTLSARQAIEWIERAYDVLRQVYPTVMIYTSSRVWTDDLADLPSKLGEAPLWIKTAYFWRAGRPYDIGSATPPPTTLPLPWQRGYPGDQGAWIQQHQGDAVKLPGFSGTVDMNRFLKMEFGEKSKRVKWVQGKVGAIVDGEFGPRTEGALRRFQLACNLPADGIVNVDTFSALCR